MIPVKEISAVCLGADNLGCVVDGPKIYLADFRGESQKETDLLIVTAAHEMLHLAYNRLSQAERERIDELVEESLDKPSNQALRDSIMQAYSDPIVAADEAHSQLGTEADSVSTELAKHYLQYFDDRQVVVEAHRNSRTFLNNLP